MQKMIKRKRVQLTSADAKGARDWADDLVPGLSRVEQPSGHESWSLRYRVNGRQRRYTLGPADQISRTQARRIANGLLLKVREGVDPADEKRTTTIRAGGVRDSFAELAEDYIETYCKVHNRSWIDLARVLGLATDKYSRKHPERRARWTLKPGSPAARWERRNVATLTGRDLMDAVHEVQRTRGTAAARKLHSTLSGFFRWLYEQRRIVEASPLIGTRLPGKPGRRKRVLDHHEIALVWHAAGDMKPPFGAYIRMLLLTGQRRNEVAGMCASEISDNIWTVPENAAGRSKSSRENPVPLVPLALEVLAAIPPVQANTKQFMFTVNSRAPISGFTRIKRALDAEIAKANRGKPIEPFTLHTLRHTTSTHMLALSLGSFRLF
jgi:integrase